ncbi:MAG: DUF1684 domain-containing protein [Hyphomonas sp.]|nr:DUF1684 domain-containing protein [Hyphomonas sp.]
MKFLPALLLGAVILAGCSPTSPAPDASGPQAGPSLEGDWQAWLTEHTESYFDGRQAVLKANDAIYIKPGETAWLTGNPEDPATYHWSIVQPEGPTALSVEFELPEPDAPHASLTHIGEIVDFGDETKTFTLSDDIEIYGGPSGLGTDDPRFVVFAFNQRHPAATDFAGLSFYAYAPDFRVEASVTPTLPPAPHIMQTERGLIKQFFEVGHANFTVSGTDVSLPLYSFSADTSDLQYLFAPFTDETTGTETYGVGRYLDLETAGGTLPETLTIDFNYAYNPLCALSDHYNCPVVEFTIPAAIKAGERYDYGLH